MAWADSKIHKVVVIALFSLDSAVALLAVYLAWGSHFESTVVVIAAILVAILIIALIARYSGHQKIFERISLYYIFILCFAFIGLASSSCSSRCIPPDSRIKSVLDASRSQAELYASNHANSYEGVCTAKEAGLVDLLSQTAIDSRAKVLPANAPQTKGTVACHDSEEAWVASAPLHSGSEYWCVDSSGYAGITTSLLMTGALQCLK
jgi:hypothetical protein